MAKKEKDILKSLKVKSDKFELPVEDFVWDAIEKDLDGKKGDKRRWLWLIRILAVTLGFSVLTAFYIWNQSSDDDQAFSSSLLNEELVSQDVYVTNQKNKNSPILPKKRRTNQSALINDQFKQESTIIVPDNYTLSNPGDKNQNVMVQNPSFLANFNKNTVTELPSDMSNMAKKVDPIFERNDSQITNQIEEKGVEEKGLNVTEEELSTEISEESQELSMTDSSKQSASIDTTATGNLPPKEIEKPAKGRLPFTLLLDIGVGRSYRTIRSNELGDLITHKNDHEKYGNCFQLGLNVQFGLSKRLFLRSGLAYKFYSDRYDFQHDIISHRTQNDYQYFQLPVLLGYNLFQFKNANLAILGGPKINLLFSAQSSWVDPGLLTPQVHSNKDNQGPFRLASSAIALRFDYHFNVGQQFKIHLMPGADYFLNSVYKKNTDINQRPYSLNFDLGLSYHF